MTLRGPSKKLCLALLSPFARLSIRDWTLGLFPNTVQQGSETKYGWQKNPLSMLCRNMCSAAALSPSTTYARETLYSLGVTHAEGFNFVFRLPPKLEPQSVLGGHHEPLRERKLGEY
jgi:hypothetical protein